MMARQVALAFELELVTLPLRRILPSRQVTEITKQSVKYRSISCSIDEVGVIEPLVVNRRPDRQGRYLLLDGHLKREILLEKGRSEAECLLAHDDEAYTYNKRINRLAAIQEHFMIVRAIERGASEQRIARALNVDIGLIRRRQKLLLGITVEAVNMLRDKPVNPVTFDALRKMKPERQIEACQLMKAASSFTSCYAKSLLAATKDEDLVKPRRPKYPKLVTSADIALMEREFKSVQQDFKTVESAYGEDLLHLTIALGYVSKLVRNKSVARYLIDNHPEMLAEFRAILSATSTPEAAPGQVKADIETPQSRPYSKGRVSRSSRAR
jgi:ParB-like chromosome segregation protein Spo0J